MTLAVNSSCCKTNHWTYSSAHGNNEVQVCNVEYILKKKEKNQEPTFFFFDNSG